MFGGGDSVTAVDGISNEGSRLTLTLLFVVNSETSCLCTALGLVSTPIGAKCFRETVVSLPLGNLTCAYWGLPKQDGPHLPLDHNLNF